MWVRRKDTADLLRTVTMFIYESISPENSEFSSAFMSAGCQAKSGPADLD
jgi:hypothetical protein